MHGEMKSVLKTGLAVALSSAVRAISRILLATWAVEIHTFWPLST